MQGFTKFSIFFALLPLLNTPVFGRDAENLATNTPLFVPSGVAVDSSGSLYISDSGHERIYKIEAGTATITIVARAGGARGDGALVVNAKFNNPRGLAVDGMGNLYIADTYRNRIRKVTASTGIMTTVAGTGTQSDGGDGGAATDAQLNYPNGVAVDRSGNLYIADTENHRIRKVTASTGVITTVAGTGVAGDSGDGGAAVHARLNHPNGIAVDEAGNLYIADTHNQRIRKVEARTAVINTIAGKGWMGYRGAGGPAISAYLNFPQAVAVDSEGNLYIADTSNHRISKVSADTNVITTISGGWGAGDSGDGGSAKDAQFENPNSIAVESGGNLYIADRSNNRIRKITASTNIIDTVAGRYAESSGR